MGTAPVSSSGGASARNGPLRLGGFGEAQHLLERGAKVLRGDASGSHPVPGFALLLEQIEARIRVCFVHVHLHSPAACITRTSARSSCRPCHWLGQTSRALLHRDERLGI